MQFVIIAYDATDADAINRRMACRQAHTEAMTKARAEGKIICGAALLDDEGKMIGSNCIMNFPSREELDAWLAVEPYITGKVWDKVTVIPAKLGDTFKDLIH